MKIKDNRGNYKESQAEVYLADRIDSLTADSFMPSFGAEPKDKIKEIELNENNVRFIFKDKSKLTIEIEVG